MAVNDDDLDRDLMIQTLSRRRPPGLQAPVNPNGIQAPTTFSPYETGGVMGRDPNGPPPVVDTPAAPVPEAPVPAAAPAASYSTRGFDAGKMADQGHQTEKYKIGRIMQKYDPKGGVTPEMLAELNALDIAKFSGSGGDLTVENTKNDPRFGKGGTSDVIFSYDAQNADTAWQPWFDEGAASAAGPSGAKAAMMGGMGGAGMGGSTLDRIRSLMPTDLDFFNRLQQQAVGAVGGAGALDRETLIRMLTQR